MGCGGSTQQSKGEENTKKLRKPKAWKHTQALTKTQLLQMRDEFWDTAPHYGGRKEIWDALHAAAEADLSLAQAIVDSAGIIVMSVDMTTCYDERCQIRIAQVCFVRACQSDSRKPMMWF